ncbi:MAG: hypothetical protein GEU95_17655 [Rhizobiales bacterium]|nr:hypothetical protein [Hyphomicrobiales bacterium]
MDVNDTEERLVRVDETTDDFDEACAKLGISPAALLLSGNHVDQLLDWSRATRDRRKRQGLLPTIKDGGRRRHPRKAVKRLYRKMVEGAGA